MPKKSVEFSERPIKLGPSKPNRALLDIYECMNRLTDGAEITKSYEGHFWVDGINGSSLSNAINLSLALKEANWEYLSLDLDMLGKLIDMADISDKINALSVANSRYSSKLSDSEGVRSQDSRGVLGIEKRVMERYTDDEVYRIYNAILRGYDEHQINDSEVKIEPSKMRGLFSEIVLGINGINKNRIVKSSKLQEAEGEDAGHNIEHHQSLTRLLSDVSPGLRAQMATQGSLITASGYQSWTYLDEGSPSVQEKKIFRLKMPAEGQRPLYDFFGRDDEGEVLLPATHYYVKGVGLGYHDSNPIIEVEVERRWGVSVEQNEHYSSLDALAVAYEKHLRHPYRHEPDQKPYGVHRSNHALAHHVRVTKYIDHVVDYFSHHAEEGLKAYCQSLEHREREKLRVLMAFSRTGRESENDFKSNPEVYKKELGASADNFKAYVLSKNFMTKKEAELWARVLKDMGNPAFDEFSRENLKEFANQLSAEDKVQIMHIHAIVNLAHKLDLPRCFNQEEYAHAVLPYLPMPEKEWTQQTIKNFVPYSEEAKADFETLKAIAQHCIEATGESMSLWPSGPHEQKEEQFMLCNSSVLACWDACTGVELANQVQEDVKPFLDKLDKVLLNPVIFKFYQKLQLLGVHDFPSDMDEMPGFLNKLFARYFMKPTLDNTQLKVLFNDEDILISILNASQISSEIIEKVLSLVDLNKICERNLVYQVERH